ncbi:MAG: tRNA (adenosine(37)-N6)-threonylcarbamoyltransferase complex dimerization subunit type 1 TsaB [Thermodesulfobacteriota bacterium]
MITLAIDTSSASGSVALVDDGRLAAEWTVGDVGLHARWLSRSIAAFLASAGCAAGDVDLFALTTGPGSFTGLRIGVSAVKGLAWTLGRPVAGVSTLEAIAMNVPYAGRLVCPVLDARKKEVYAALYRLDGPEAVAVMPDSAMSPAALFERIERLCGPLGPVFLGSGLGAYGDLIRERVPGAELAPEPLWHLRASNVALIAGRPGAARVDASGLVPVYLRRSEAEIKGRAARNRQV